ncbi:hypothetical protein U1Q18_042566, partial [Sarracenia purpurea var. burkii]
SFIEHQDTCTLRGQVRPELQALQPACSSRTASSTSPSSDTNFSNNPPFRSLSMQGHVELAGFLYRPELNGSPATTNEHTHNLELQLLPSSNAYDQNHSTNLKLSIGSPPNHGEKINAPNHNSSCSSVERIDAEQARLEASRLKEGASEQLKLAMAEKAYAEETRRQAKTQIELAEMEFANARRIRQQAQAELEKAQLLKEQATKKISATVLQITCHSCKQQFQATTSSAAATAAVPAESLAASYVSSAVTEGDGAE